MRFKSIVKQTLKKTFHSLGVEVTRAKNCTEVNYLGLKNYPFDTIIDVGANTGQFTKKTSKIYPDATIYCFEPLPEAYSALSKWAETMDGKVIPINIAIGDENKNEVDIFLHEDHSPSSPLLSTTGTVEKLYPSTKKKITVKQKTLNTALSDINLGKRLLIKMDVQGFEDRVISGGNNIFKKATACIIEILLDELYKGQATFEELYLMLAERDYLYKGNLDQTYAPDGHCIFIDALFLKNENGKIEG